MVMMALSRSFPAKLCCVSCGGCVFLCVLDRRTAPSRSGTEVPAALPGWCQRLWRVESTCGFSSPPWRVQAVLHPHCWGFSCTSKGHIPPLPPLQQQLLHLALSCPATFPGGVQEAFSVRVRGEKQPGCLQAPFARGKAKDLEMSPVY